MRLIDRSKGDLMPRRESSRSWRIDVMRHFLDKVPKHEIIEALIKVISTICENDKDFDKLTHNVITHIQAREIIAGRSNLEDYQEPHRSELEKEIKEFHK